MPARRTISDPPVRRGFSMVELLVVVAVVSMLMAILLPSLSNAHEQAKRAKCASNLRQLGVAFHMYASDYDGHAMPLSYTNEWPMTYWYGRECGTGRPDQTGGFVWPYLHSDLRDQGVYECPSQPLGEVDILQGGSDSVTTTYGYNGYFLAPRSTPGRVGQIGHRPWQNLDTLSNPQLVFVFADTMLQWGDQLGNCALLEPPFQFDRRRRRWRREDFATTSFRHDWLANAVHADGHAASYAPDPNLITSREFQLGSVGPDNGPHYVPDWRDW